MNSQDNYSLQEAYSQIYEGKIPWDNSRRPLKSGWTPREKNRAKRISLGVENPDENVDDKKLERYGSLKNAHDTQSNIKQPKPKDAHKYRHRNDTYSRLDIEDPMTRQLFHPYKTKLQRIYNTDGPSGLREPKEEMDLYDIILTHLLDESYASTKDAAEVIMVNMSEEWRESICEELTGERKKRALEKGGYLANRVASGKEGQPLERINRSGDVTMRTTKKGPTKRGGMGFKGKTKSDWYGTDDAHGYANKSRRRRGIEVKDTSDDL